LDAGEEIPMQATRPMVLKQAAATDEFQQTSTYARNLIEASLDPLVTISPEGKITDVNEATVRVTGVSRDKLIGTDFSNYFTEPEKAREGYRQVFAEGFVTDYPLTIRSKDNTLTSVLYNASVYKDSSGNVLGVFAAARDMTAQNKVSKLTALNEKLTAANNDLDAFSYSVSHDLRAPLRAVEGFSRILLEDYGGKLDEEGRRLLNVVCDNTVKMSHMIDDILALSRAGRAEVTSSSVNMEAQVRAVIADLETATAGQR
jgi:PAS domain S-box-containing protein